MYNGYGFCGLNRLISGLIKGLFQSILVWRVILFLVISVVWFVVDRPLFVFKELGENRRLLQSWTGLDASKFQSQNRGT